MRSRFLLLAGITIYVHYVVSTDARIGLANLSDRNLIYRRTRSGFTVGKAAMKALLKGTKEVPTQSTNYRKYLKQGNLQEAISDFKLINPNLIDTDRRPYLKQGMLEDKTFLRLTMSDRSNHRRPTIFIADHERTNPIKIVYIDKPMSKVI